MQTQIFDAEEAVIPNAADTAVPDSAPAGTDIATMAPAARAAVALGSTATEKHLRELVTKSAAITTVVDVNGRAEAHSSYMALRTARTSITNTGKAAREDAQAFCTSVIKEEKRLIEITQDEEDRVKGLRDKFDAEEKRKAEELAQKQAARKAELQGKVDAIRNIPLGMAESSAADITIEIGNLREFVPAIETFFEFADDAQAAANAAIVLLMGMLDNAVARELAAAEQERQRVEADRIAKEAADREAAALAERQGAAARAEQELADRMRVIAEQQRALDDQAAAIAKARADADATLAAERAKFDAERKAFADQQAAAAAADIERKRVADETKAQMDMKAASANAARQEAESPVPSDITALELGADEIPSRPFEHATIADAEIMPNSIPQFSQSLVDQLPVGPRESGDGFMAPTSFNAVATVVGTGGYIGQVPVDVPFDTVITFTVGTQEVSAPPSMRLGQIGVRLGFVVTEQFLSSLGFPVAAKDKNACLYHESDYPHICRAIIRYVESKINASAAGT